MYNGLLTEYNYKLSSIIGVFTPRPNDISRGLLSASKKKKKKGTVVVLS